MSKKTAALTTTMWMVSVIFPIYYKKNKGRKKFEGRRLGLIL